MRGGRSRKYWGRVPKQSELIRNFNLSRIQAFPADIAKRTAVHFGITHQAVSLVNR